MQNRRANGNSRENGWKEVTEKLKAEGHNSRDLEKEKQELSEKLTSLQSSKSKLPKDNTPIAVDIAVMEARKEELSLALSHIEDILQLKTKDLVRRISRVYEEAGDFEAGRDFRRISNQMEAAENFGEFVRALLGE